jgi:hypothetical protein
VASRGQAALVRHRVDGTLASAMVRPRRHHLLLALLVALAVAWPLAKPVPNFFSHETHASAAPMGDGCDGCVEGVAGDISCPAAACAVSLTLPAVPTIAPTFGAASAFALVDERGVGRVPGIPDPPPRPSLPA